VVDDGGEFEELPFLEIGPAERLFEHMGDQNCHGNTYRSVLFERPIRIEFLLAPETAKQYGDPIEACIGRATISAHDPQCPVIEVGIDVNKNWLGQDCHYFSAGSMTYLSDDHPWSGLTRSDLQEVILDYVKNTMQFGLFEFWKSKDFQTDEEETNFEHPFCCGPLRVPDRSPGWLRRAIEQEKLNQRAWDRRAKQNLSNQVLGLLAGVVIFLLISPVLIPLLLCEHVHSCFTKNIPHARRYPPFPLK